MPASRSASRRYALTHEFPFSRAQVWRVLAHTDRLNRQIGLAPVFYGEAARDQHGIYRPARAKLGALWMHWREYLFEWEHEKSYTVVRRYQRGPIAHFEGGIKLESLDENLTRATIWSEIAPQGAVGALIVPLMARRFLQRTLRFCQAAFAAPEAPTSPLLPPTKNACDEAVLTRLIVELRAFPIRENYAAALGQFLRAASEDEVAALRPFAWADGAGLDRDEALRVCLYAVRAGLLNLRWSMMCPNCRVSKSEADTLAKVQSSVHCDLCGVDYDLNFDRYVELEFAVHPSVRAASRAVYCLGGPLRTPHILEQLTLEAGQSHAFGAHDATELRLRTIGSNRVVDLADQRAQSWILNDEAWRNAPVTDVNAPAAIWVANATQAAAAIVLEKREWDESAVTAARVTALQEFRALFSSEVLAPGRQVAVENVTIFFSDLSNSTALYERIGDAPAYSRVGRHFEFLTDHIADGGGAIVKTMGDAVMAIFHRPEEAVATAIRVQQEFAEFVQTLEEGDGLRLKIGLHRGPVLAVNSNERLDYFGRTVNIAARAVGLSNGDDIILTGEVWRAPQVQQRVSALGARALTFQAALRGVEERHELVRLRMR